MIPSHVLSVLEDRDEARKELVEAPDGLAASVASAEVRRQTERLEKAIQLYCMETVGAALDFALGKVQAKLEASADLLPKYCYGQEDAPYQNWEYSMTLPTPLGNDEYSPAKSGGDCLQSFMEALKFVTLEKIEKGT